jgi:UDP-N-acetylmuramoylalanine--D-glutamate ligase
VRLADLRDRSVAVWGTGPEGRAAVAAVAQHDPSRLLAVDDSAGYLAVEWTDEKTPLAGGDHAFPALVTADVVVRSPEIPAEHPWLAELHQRGITVTTGSALWLAEHAPRTIAVTGSDETASLLSHLLTALGRPNVLGGPPLLALPEAGEYVVRLAPEACEALTASPRVAVVARSGPLDVLARHPEMIVVNGADLPLRDAVRGRTDANGFPPIPAGADDSRFRVEDDAFHCSDEVLFPRATLRSADGLILCLALAVLDGLGIDVPGRRDELSAAVASH